MRLLGSLAIVLILIVGLSFWTNYSLQTSTDDITRKIDQVMIEIQNEQWATAEKQTDEIEKTWAKEAKWWPIFLDHQEIDNIEFSLSKAKEYVFSHNTSLSRGQLSELKLMVRHIPEKEAFNFKNIL